MPQLIVNTNTLQPGIAQVPVFSVGDDTSWTLRFWNGTAYYAPSSVSVKLGNIGGLENITYKNAFRFMDRMNMQSVASDFTLTSGVPGDITWDVAPQYLEGGRGCYMIRGYRPPSSILRSIFITKAGSTASVDTAFGYVGSTLTNMGAITLTDESQKIISSTVTNPGSGYTSQPTATISGAGTGAAATVIINGQGFVTAVIVTAKGSGYTGTPTVAISGGGGSGATASLTKGTTNATTSVSVSAFAGNGNLSSLPSIFAGTSPNTITVQTGQLEAGGIEYNSVCFVRDPITQEVLTGVICIPVWNGRLSAGSRVYDDALLIIRPRVILSPTFTPSGTTYSGTMDPVTDWVKAVLRYRRSCSVDIEVFGDSRLLFIGKLTVMNDAQ